MGTPTEMEFAMRWKLKEEPLQSMLLEVVIVLVVVVLSSSSLRLVVEQLFLEDCIFGNPVRPIWQRKSKPWMSSWMQQCDHVMTPFAQENIAIYKGLKAPCYYGYLHLIKQL